MPTIIGLTQQGMPMFNAWSAKQRGVTNAAAAPPRIEAGDARDAGDGRRAAAPARTDLDKSFSAAETG
jgi:hypothetical protein